MRPQTFRCRPASIIIGGAHPRVTGPASSTFPSVIAGGHGDFSLAVLTAYAYTHLDQSGQGSTLSHMLDTKLNTSYAIVGKLPVDIMLGLDFNLPSGKTDLNLKDLSLIMDPDLIAINNFGEGWNINPTVTVSKAWQKWVAGIGFGYLWRGEYDYSSELNVTDYKPGDIYKIDGELRYYLGSDLYSRLFGSHSWYGRDKVRGQDFYQEGEFTLVGLGLNYSRDKKWDANVALRGIFREKNRIPTSTGTLADESDNSHGDEWIADLGVRYFLDEKTMVRSCLPEPLYHEKQLSEGFGRFCRQERDIFPRHWSHQGIEFAPGRRVGYQGFYQGRRRNPFPGVPNPRVITRDSPWP